MQLNHASWSNNSDLDRLLLSQLSFAHIFILSETRYFYKTEDWLFSAVLRLLGVVETSYTEMGLLLGAGPPVRPGLTLWCCVCWAVSFLLHSGSSSEKGSHTRVATKRRVGFPLPSFRHQGGH